MENKTPKKRGRPVKQKQEIVNAVVDFNEDFPVGVVLSQKYGNVISVYESQNFSASGDPRGYNIDQLLRDKQGQIYRIFELMNYYVTADPLFGGAIKKVLTPFSLSKWYLVGGSEEDKEKVREYFKQIDINNLLRDLFYESYLYDNVYAYDRGSWIDLFPPTKINIADITIDGRPILEYQIEEFSRFRGLQSVDEKYIDTVKEKYKGYPEEIIKGIENREKWVQLNPDKTYVLQGAKSRYEKFAIPFGTEALRAFSKKNLISELENAQINLGMKGFLHVQVGDKDILKKVSAPQLQTVGQIFKDAINGFPLAVTPWNVSAKWVEISNQITFDKSKYNNVNAEILAACGLASIIITGNSDGGSYAQAVVNTAIAEKRIAQNQQKASELIALLIKNKSSELGVNPEDIPIIFFEKVSLQDDQAARNEVLKLFEKGLVSYKTTHEKLGYDHKQELERKKAENKESYQDIFSLPKSFNNQTKEDNNGGRPEKDGDRKTDKNKSKTGAQPKPSTE